MSTEEIHLREYIERIIEEMDRRYEQRFQASQRENVASLTSAREALQAALAASEKAVNKAEESSIQRMDAHNQLQAKLDRQAVTFADRDWVNEKLTAMLDRVTIIERRVSKFEDRESGMSLTAKIAVGLVSIVATLVALYFALKHG